MLKDCPDGRRGQSQDGILGRAGVPEEGYQHSVLSAGGLEYCVGGGGDVGDRIDGECWAGGAAECDWGRGVGAQGTEVTGEEGRCRTLIL